MTKGETWRFELRDPQADRVYLVTDREGGFSTWMAMDRQSDDQWSLITDLLPGHYRVRYFRSEGQTFFNAGSAGLVGQRVAGDDPSVTLESLQTLEAV